MSFHRQNTELPVVQVPEHRVNYLAPRFLLGYLFLLCAFALTVTLIYQVRDRGPVPAPDQETGSGQGQVCIQVVTPARHMLSGEIREFPTPCDVPEGWVPQAIGPESGPGIGAVSDFSEWATFDSQELGIRFRYPQEIFRDLKLITGRGETFDYADSPETVKGRSFGGNYLIPMNETDSYANWIFLFTGVSDDFETNREGEFTDTTGFVSQGGRHYFRYIDGALMDLDQDYVSEIRGVNTTGIFLEPMPFPRDDDFRFQPYVNEFGAIFNLKSADGFRGIAFLYNVPNAQNEPSLLDAHRPIFRQMMESVEIY